MSIMQHRGNGSVCFLLGLANNFQRCPFEQGQEVGVVE